MLNIDITPDIVSGVLFLLLAILAVLVFIAAKIGSGSGGGRTERVVEKHYVGATKKPDEEDEGFEGETEEERAARIQRDIDLEQRWAKDGKVDSNLGSIGTKEHIDGESSKKAVDLLRKMNKGKDVSK